MSVSKRAALSKSVSRGRGCAEDGDDDGDDDSDDDDNDSLSEEEFDTSNGAVIEWVGSPICTVGSDTFYSGFAFAGRETDPIRINDCVSFRVATGHYDVNPDKVRP